MDATNRIDDIDPEERFVNLFGNFNPLCAAVPPPAGDRVDTMTRYHRTQFFRMKKVFTGQHFHRIAFDSSSQWMRPKLPLLALIQDLKKGL